MMMLMPKRRNTFDIFEEMFNDPFFNGFSRQQSNLMQSDVKENDKQYLIDINLPGYDKENIELSIDNGYLNINAKIEESKDDEKENYIHKERYVGECHRSFYVGDDIKEEDVKANFKNGILKLTIPKKEEKKIENKKFISIE